MSSPVLDSSASRESKDPENAELDEFLPFTAGNVEVASPERGIHHVGNIDSPEENYSPRGRRVTFGENEEEEKEAGEDAEQQLIADTHFDEDDVADVGSGKKVRRYRNAKSLRAPKPRVAPKKKVYPRGMNKDLFLYLKQSRKSNKGEIKPALVRRMRDFRFAQNLRKERYSGSLYGIMGIYDRITGIRTDIEWAEDAAWRRENERPYLRWEDFEDAKDTGYNRPFFVYGVLLICTICFVVSIAINGDDGWSFEPLSKNPMIGPSGKTLIRMGARVTSKIIDGEWYRLVTPMFLHAGLIHFVLNMGALWALGVPVEQSHGFWNVFVVFVLPAVGANLISAIFLPQYVTVGASGGIFGLIGACLADIVTNWNLLFNKVLNDSEDNTVCRNVIVLLWLVLDVLVNAAVGLTPFVDNFAHMGGMVYGFLCGLSKLERLSPAFFGEKATCFSKFKSYLIRFFGLAFTLIMIVTSIIVLHGDKNHCPNCRYISCAPFPFWVSMEKRWWHCDDCGGDLGGTYRVNPGTEKVLSVTFTCPDNEVANVDLRNESVTTKTVAKAVPNLCRKHCKGLWKVD